MRVGKFKKVVGTSFGSVVLFGVGCVGVLFGGSAIERGTAEYVALKSNDKIDIFL